MHRSVFTARGDADITTDETPGEPKAPSNEPETLMPTLEAIITCNVITLGLNCCACASVNVRVPR